MNREPKGQPTGGRFAASVNPESDVDLASTPSWDYRNIDVDDVDYFVTRTENHDLTVTYEVLDRQFGTGWTITDDPLTRRAIAKGIRPNLSVLSEEDQIVWRERGDADIRHVLEAIGSPAALVDIDGKTYLVHGRQDWPLTDDTVTGINIGQMMLIKESIEHPVAFLSEYVAQGRRSAEIQLKFRPDMSVSIQSTLRTLNGIEIAAGIGVDAARANTVGAYEARSAVKTKESA